MDEEAVFTKAIGIQSAEDRAAFLDESCGDDAQLRSKVEFLIRLHDESGEFLERPAFEGRETELLKSVVAGRHDPTDPAQGPTPLNDIPLDFLDPAQQSGSLGRLKQYEVLEVVGRGGMGIVLKAQDTRLNRTVAVKVLAPELASNSMARKRFLREAQAAAAVSHDHVVTIFAVEESETPGHGRLPYLVMEFIDGQSLQQKIDHEGHLELREILRIGRQIAAGLAAAHEQGLIHRDVKPANILLQNSVQRVQITDFGLARAVDDVGMTRTGEVTGTPQFMSPEQAQGQPVDTRSDLFSLGSVLYAMCTGRSPFRADTTVASLRRVCDDTPRPIREINPDVPEWLVEIIERLLEKNPEDRVQTAAEVAQVLGQHLAHLQDPGSSPFPGAVQPIRQRQASAGGLWRWLVPAAAALVMVAALIGATEATGVTHFSSTVIRLVYGEGTLVIEVGDPDVSVTVDGRDLVITGAGLRQLRLTPGSYKVTATKNGRRVKTELVTIIRGGTEVVSVTMERDAASPAPSTVSTDSPRLFAHTTSVSAVAVSPDGKLVAAAGGVNVAAEEFSPTGDYSISVWEVASGKLVKRLTGHQAMCWANGLCFSPDGAYLASGSFDKTVRLWDIASGSEVHKYVHENCVTAVAFSPEGGRLLSGSNDGTAVLWDLEGSELRRFKAHQKLVVSVAFSPDSRQIVTGGGPVEGGHDATLGLWNVETGELVRAIPTIPNALHGINAVRFLDDGERILIVGFGKTGAHSAQVWDVQSGRKLRDVGDFRQITYAAVSSDGSYMLAGDYQQTMQLWDLRTNKRVARYSHEDQIRGVAFSPDQRLAFSACNDGNVYAWQLPESVWTKALDGAQDGAQDYRAVPPGSITRVQRLQGHSGMVTGVSFLSDGRQCLSGSGDGTMQLWDVATGKSLRRYDAQSFIWQTALSPSGITAASAHLDGRIFLWDITTGKRISELKGHTAQVHHVEFSPDGKLLLSRSSDKTIRLWDVDRGTELQRLDCEQEVSTAAIFAGDNDHILIADGTRFALWNLKPVQQVWSAQLGTYPIYNLALSPDAGLVALASGDGKIYVVDKDDGSLIATFQPHTLSRMRFTPDGRHLVSGGQDGSLRIWSLETFSEVARLESQTHCTDRIDVSPDARYVVSGSGGYLDSSTGSRGVDDTDLHVWQLPESVWTMDYRIAQVSRAIEDSPQDSNAWFARAQLYIEQSQWEQATEDLRQAVDRAPEDPLARLAYPALLIKAGKLEEYRRFCRTLLEKFRGTQDPSDADQVTKICLMQPGEFEVSELPLDLIDNRLAANTDVSTRANFCATRALVCYRSGDMQGAIRWARECVLKPDGQPLHLRARWLLILAMAHHAEGNEAEARQAFHEARSHFNYCIPFAAAGRDPHWTAGWLAADLLRSEAEDVLGISAEKGAFAVLSSDGAEVGKFDTLAEAVTRSGPGDTIEIRGDGPFVSDPIQIVHPLTIKAGEGRRPVVRQSQETLGADHLITMRRDLVLEGVTLETVGKSFAPEDWSNRRQHVIAQFNASLLAVNCRFVQKNVIGECVSLPGGGFNMLRNCELVMHPERSSAMRCFTLSSDTAYVVENCCIVSDISLHSRRADLRDCTFRCRRNTVIGALRIAVAEIPELAKADRSSDAPIVLQVSQSVLDPGLPDAVFRADFTPTLVHQTEQAKALLPAIVDWRGEWNLLPSSTKLLEIKWDAGERIAEPLTDVADWNRFWKLTKSGALQGPIRCQGGSLWERAKIAPERITAEDFRLRPDSAGYQAGPDGKDLGADIDLVGPGEAYERWKKTPAYDAWRKEAQALMTKDEPPSQLRSEAVDVLGIKDEQGAFVVLDGDRAEVGKFDTLAAAVGGSSSGDAIEIRGNGPFIIDPLEIPHALTIRAADGCRPVISNFEPPEAGVSLLLNRAPLVLEGLEFDLVCRPIPTLEGGNVIVGHLASPAALYCGNCTFRKTTVPVRSDVYLHPCIASAAKRVRLVNCQIATPLGYSIHWNCAPEGRFSLENCLVSGTAFFNSSRPPQPDVSIRLERNTFFLVEDRFAYLSTHHSRSAEAGKELRPRIRFEALQNIFDTKGSILHFGTPVLGEPRTAADALALLSQEVAWHGDQNLLPESSTLLEMRVGERTVEFEPPIDAAQWQTLWQTSHVDAGTVHYQGGDLRAQRLAQQTLYPEDFRLHSDSAGFRAGPDGQDVGADVDLVGPGEAYERWKQTDEYKKWQTETGALISAAIEKDRESFVVLDADRAEVGKFDTLAAAVGGSSSGDTIEIRGNGPFLIEPLVIDQALTIKAADGFQPVIEGIASDDQNQLLMARGPLVMEGLDIHWKRPAQERREARVIRAYAPLGMANCRVRGDGRACLWAGQNSVLQNCQFFSGIGWMPPTSGSFHVENCICTGSLCLFPRDVKDASLHLHGNTFLASSALGMIPTKDPQTALEDPLAKVVRISSSRNLFRVPTRQLFSLQTVHLGESYDAASAGALLRRVVGWSEQQNLYPNNVPLLVLFRDDEEPLSGDYRQDFEGWNRFWELKDTGSSQGAVSYAGGNLEVKLKNDPEHLVPEDFRLRPDSAGYRAGPDGEDLGADINLVGPGEAYERWKQLPAYDAWRKEAQGLITEDGPPSKSTAEDKNSAASPAAEQESDTASE